jgi:MFS family permease
MMLGSSIGGKLITYGRIKVLKFAAYSGIIGCSMTIYEIKNDLNFFFNMLIFGRFLYGVATGLIAIAVPRYIEEILP